MDLSGFFSLVLAIFGLGFLVFIHELGHFWMARREGMKVEAFSIGFGKPLISWMKNGVRWQISWIPFGGFVKIAGMQKEHGKEPHEILGGFFSKTPWQRIKVSFMGPAVNLLFGLVLFGILWLSGGREKPFSEFTKRIGWIDPQSTLYQKGVRPGDLIESYNGRNFGGIRDLMIEGIMKNPVNSIRGVKIDPLTHQRESYDYTLKTYANPQGLFEQKTIGILAPASYLFYDTPSHSSQLVSPMSHSGIQNGDRIFWADGEVLFSRDHLTHTINASSAFFTVERNGQIFHAKVPRVHLSELSLTPMQKAELDDWQYEANLEGKLDDLFFVPYLLSPSGEVEMRLGFIDEEDQRRAFQTCERCAYFHPLKEGDRIVAIDGQQVETSYELLHQLQTRRVLLVVQRNAQARSPISWQKADQDFDRHFNAKDLQALVSSIGTNQEISHSGNLYLLRPVEPKPFPEVAALYGHDAATLEKQLEQLRSIEDPQKRKEQIEQLEKMQKRLFLGIAFHDREVTYNPSPIKQLFSVCSDTWRTLSNLFSGNLSPKYMSGPVGIIQVVQFSWTQGIKEALFWMGFISLNLGIFNLLPIPVLDGGHICFSLYEVCTRRRISAKMMERLVLPFFGLLIVFFIYITYQDVSRLLSRFF